MREGGWWEKGAKNFKTFGNLVSRKVFELLTWRKPEVGKTNLGYPSWGNVPLTQQNNLFNNVWILKLVSLDLHEEGVEWDYIILHFRLERHKVIFELKKMLKFYLWFALLIFQKHNFCQIWSFFYLKILSTFSTKVVK